MARRRRRKKRSVAGACVGLMMAPITLPTAIIAGALKTTPKAGGAPGRSTWGKHKFKY